METQEKTKLRKRRFFQIAALLALHASWGPEFKWFCLPVLSCHSCAVSWFACPIGVLVHFAGYQVFPFFALGTIAVLGTLAGRILCGWVCPFGFLQDLLYKVPGRKFTLPGWMRHVKWGVLGAGVIALPFFLGPETWFSFCRVCPASALQVSAPNVISHGIWAFNTGVAIKFVVLVGVVWLAVGNHRSFCKVFCPVGALLSPLNHLAFWSVKMPREGCAACGKCDRVCPMDGDPSSRIEMGVAPNRAMECIVCHSCQSVCPVRNGKENAPSSEGNA